MAKSNSDKTTSSDTETESEDEDNIEWELVKPSKYRGYICEIPDCSAKFQNRLHRRIHLLKVHQEPVPCSFKGCQSLVKPMYMWQHIKSRHEKSKRQCIYCGKLMLKNSLYQHQITCGAGKNSQMFSCTVTGCKQTFVSKYRRNFHVKQTHAKPVPCPRPECGKFFKPRLLGPHLKLVHGRQRCPKCLKLVELNLLEEHKENNCLNFKKRKTDCSVSNCSASFETDEDKMMHMKQEHGRKLYPLVPCPYAGCQVSVNAKNVTRHIREIHEVAKLRCDNCGKDIKKYYFNQHWKICSNDGSRKYICSFAGCKADFKTDFQRNNHEYMVHSPRVPCEVEGCKMMLKVGAVKNHVARVHNTQRQECSWCKSQVKSIKKHLLTCKRKDFGSKKEKEDSGASSQ